ATGAGRGPRRARAGGGGLPPRPGGRPPAGGEVPGVAGGDELGAAAPGRGGKCRGPGPSGGGPRPVHRGLRDARPDRGERPPRPALWLRASAAFATGKLDSPGTTGIPGKGEKSSQTGTAPVGSGLDGGRNGRTLPVWAEPAVLTPQAQGAATSPCVVSSLIFVISRPTSPGTFTAQCRECGFSW